MNLKWFEEIFETRKETQSCHHNYNLDVHRAIRMDGIMAAAAAAAATGIYHEE